jgi:ZIP family zinc transporter
MNTIWLGFGASLLAGMGTAIGALPVLGLQQVSQRWQGLMLGLGGGVMLAATSFSLIVPATEIAELQGYSQGAGAAIACSGIAIGAALLWWLHNHFPHEHFIQGREGPDASVVQRIWLFIIAITIHNFPEGLAVGVGFCAPELYSGVPLMIGIGLQNLPEGLVVALALRELQYSVGSAFGIAAATGLAEPLGGLLGAGLVSLGQTILPWGLAIAAGAMLFVIVDEVIPEIDRKSCRQEGTLGVIAGFLVMTLLDIALG